jgi:hypothetical protein
LHFTLLRTELEFQSQEEHRLCEKSVEDNVTYLFRQVKQPRRDLLGTGEEFVRASQFVSRRSAAGDEIRGMVELFES